MLSRLFGSKKKEKSSRISDANYNWGFLGVDMHSHLIPGVDDGAQTVEDSVQLVRRMMDMGFRAAVTTPHVKHEHYPNTSDTINTGLHVLRNALHEQQINFPIRAAAEYYIDDSFMELLETQPLLTVTDNQVLVELSFMSEPMGLADILFKIQTLGYKPILAHPERYQYMHERPQIYEELRNRGCYLQLNTNSLTGYYGKGVKTMAEKLLANGLYDYCGSDMHHEKHADVLKSVLRSHHIEDLMQRNFLNNQVNV
ncbi:MAG: CpsB/CapC family capsule biosynthesis tyrosine phosphatase [Flavipsychrobacter sp.]